MNIDRSKYSVKLPLSKSIAARRLILDYILHRDCGVDELPDCDDTRELQRALNQLRQHPTGEDQTFYLGTGGTSLRFFVALVASIPDFTGFIDCAPALQKRPLWPLIDALRLAGAEIEFVGREGTFPLLIRGRKLSGDSLIVDTSVSSQFASAIAMASLLWTPPWRPRIMPGSNSAPYLEMTLKMIDAAVDGLPLHNEADWSAASYFYEYALLNPGVATRLQGLLPQSISLQGDSVCESIFGKLGVNTVWKEKRSPVISCDAVRNNRVKLNMSETPDLVPALAAAMCGANIPFHIEGIANLRVKESNRIEALCLELARFGYKLIAGNDSISFYGFYDKPITPPYIDSHRDHRLAMCMSVLAYSLFNKGEISKLPNILDMDSVTKSFPGFYAELHQLRNDF